MLPIDTGWPSAADTCASTAARTLAPVRTLRASSASPMPATTMTADGHQNETFHEQDSCRTGHSADHGRAPRQPASPRR